MDKEYIKKILVKANQMCQERYKTTLYNKLEMKIDDVDDLATVLTSDKIDDIMSSGRIEFSKKMVNIGSVITASIIAPLGIVGTLAGLALLLNTNQKEMSNKYRDIVRQLYSNNTLYRAYKKLPQNEMSVDDAANILFSELASSFGAPA